MKKYKIVNGVSFDKNTNARVIEILLNAMKNKERIRVFYGDTQSGIDWCETYDTIGTISVSCGTIKVPLMIHSIRSMGGDAILTEDIVKITKDKKVIYKHPKYNCNVSINDKCNVVRNGKEILFLNSNDPIKANRFLSFLKGERNNY